MNFGIIGCGLIGQKRAKSICLLDSPKMALKITLCCDTNLKRAQDIASNHKGCLAVEDWQTVVNSRDVDVVVIATTHNLLAPIALAALENGKRLIVEKPAARSSRELEPVLRLSQKTGLQVKVGFNHRFHPALWKAHQMVTAGEIGELYYIRGRYGHGGRIGYDKEWRSQPQLSGGGELIDQGVHLIDLARWFLGEFTEVQGHVATYFWDMPVDDNAFLSLQTAKKQTAWLHATWTEWKNTFSFEICGKRGKLQIEGLGGSYGIERLAFYQMQPEMGPPPTTIWEFPFPDVSWEAELQEFVSAIQQDRRTIGDVADAYEALKIVDQIYQNRFL